jgi:hypothetical protein
MSKFMLCKNDGILHNFKNGQNTPGYGVNQKALVDHIKQHNPELHFIPLRNMSDDYLNFQQDENVERSEDFLIRHQNEESIGNRSAIDRKLIGKVTPIKRQLNSNRNATEVKSIGNPNAMDFPLQSHANPGFFKNSASRPHTRTDRHAIDKSHKSEERDFSKNEPQIIGSILRGLRDRDAVHDSTTVQDMFKIWKEEFSGSDERANTRSAGWLKAAYDTSFDGVPGEITWVKPKLARLSRSSRICFVCCGCSASK